jgi:hypothetical protein
LQMVVAGVLYDRASVFGELSSRGATLLPEAEQARVEKLIKVLWSGWTASDSEFQVMLNNSGIAESLAMGNPISLRSRFDSTPGPTLTCPSDLEKLADVTPSLSQEQQMDLALQCLKKCGVNASEQTQKDLLKLLLSLPDLNWIPVDYHSRPISLVEAVERLVSGRNVYLMDRVFGQCLSVEGQDGLRQFCAAAPKPEDFEQAIDQKSWYGATMLNLWQSSISTGWKPR